jgi:hypothetical protein
MSVRLVGSGSMYLWTKNALERNGFSVDDSSTRTIEITGNEWRVDGKVYSKLSELVERL